MLRLPGVATASLSSSNKAQDPKRAFPSASFLQFLRPIVIFGICLAEPGGGP